MTCKAASAPRMPRKSLLAKMPSKTLGSSYIFLAFTCKPALTRWAPVNAQHRSRFTCLPFHYHPSNSQAASEQMNPLLRLRIQGMSALLLQLYRLMLQNVPDRDT